MEFLYLSFCSRAGSISVSLYLVLLRSNRSANEVVNEALDTGFGTIRTKNSSSWPNSTGTVRTNLNGTVRTTLITGTVRSKFN